jgi:hypothetical protein
MYMYHDQHSDGACPDMIVMPSQHRKEAVPTNAAGAAAASIGGLPLLLLRRPAAEGNHPALCKLAAAAADGNRQNAFVPNGNTNAWGDNWLEYAGARLAVEAAAAAAGLPRPHMPGKTARIE